MSNFFGRAACLAALLTAFAPLPSLARADRQALAARINGAPSRIPRAGKPISVDGQLDEPAWANALKIELPFEVHPGDNLPSGVATEGLLAYDENYLYAAFVAHDPDPGKIRARLTDRDAAFQDDFVGIVVDTFNDERRAFEFFVNAMGVQMDLVQDDVAGSEDSSWDAIWNSAGRLTDGGYQVEMAIPYTSLRFQKEDGDQVWGLDLIRIYPRDQRFLFSSNRRDKDKSCYLCQVGKIVGFEGATPGKNLEITPTLTTIRTDSRDFDPTPNGGLAKGDTESELGLTAKWGVTPNLTLAGTVNPDFSQVEADSAQLAVNNQFALFFPEKRPFFLEGADFFSTPLDTVHTRAVADPAWGSKLTGKEGKNALGAFIAQDDLTNIIFPGSQFSSASSLDEQTTDGVFRYRRDMGRNSALGAVLTTRHGAGDYHNDVFGVDALLRPAESDTIRLQALGSQTQYDPGVAASFGQPLDEFGGTAYHASYAHDKKYWSAWGRYTDLGRDFRSDLGFVPQVDVRIPVAGYERRWWAEEGSWWTRAGLGGDFDQTEDHEGNLLEREYEAWAWISGPMQSFINFDFGRRKAAWRDELFDQPFWGFWYEIQPIGDVYMGIQIAYSRRADFGFEDPADPGAARQGDEVRIGPEFRYNLGRRMKLSGFHQRRTLDVDGGQAFSERVSQLNVAYQMTLRSFFRAILIYRDVDRNLDLYPLCGNASFQPGAATSCPFDPKTRSLFSQLLFSYKINPQTALFVGYSDDQIAQEFDPRARLDDYGLTRADRTFFFKVGYAFVD